MKLFDGIVGGVRKLADAASGRRDPRPEALREMMTSFGFAAEQYFPWLTDPNFAIQTIDDVVAKHGLAIYREMEQDDMISSCLSLLKLGRLSTGWEITPRSGDGVDKKISDWVKNNHETLSEVAMERVLMETLDAMNVGFFVGVPDFGDPVKSGEWSGKRPWRAYRPLPQETIAIKRDRSGNIEPDGIWQVKPGSSVPSTLDPLYYDKIRKDRIVHWFWRSRYGNPYGLSLLHSAYPWYFIKRHAVKWWGRHLEFFGLPLLIAWVAKNSSKSQMDDMLEILKHLQFNQRAVFKDQTRIEAKEVSSSGVSNHDLLINRCDRGIGRSLLIASTILDNPEVGTYALGKEHKGTLEWVLGNVGRLLSREVVESQIFRKDVTMNFGPQYDVPIFQWKDFREPDRVARATVAKVLFDMGWSIPKRYIEKALGVEWEDDEEEAIRGPGSGGGAGEEDGPPLPTGDEIPPGLVEGDEPTTALALDYLDAIKIGDEALIEEVLSGEGKRSRIYARDLFGGEEVLTR